MIQPLIATRPVSEEATEDEPPAKQAKKQQPGAFWQAAPLLLTRRTEEAEQVPAPKLKQVEDLSESALPATTDTAATIQGGRRYEQIGQSAATKLLSALLEGIELPAGIRAVVVVDTALGVGDFFWAWLERPWGNP